MKKCTQCGNWKPLEEFNKDKQNKDGRQYECRECTKNKRKKPTIINEQGLEVRIKFGATTYWKDGVMVGRKCTVCGKNKEIGGFNFKNKKKGTYRSCCKECAKRYREDNKEHYKELKQQWDKENEEQIRQYRENNKERDRNRQKQYRENNKEKERNRYKKYYNENKGKVSRYHKKHYLIPGVKERHKKLEKLYRENIKEHNLQYISSIVEQINPVFKQLNLPVYGYVYMFENVKTGHKYLGQTIKPIARRYKGGIVQGWIKERKEKQNQKFLDELIEEDIIVTELFDVAFCQYHLNVLEAYWINYYDSYNNGYNNTAGNHITNDGIEEFNQILSDHNLEFKDGKLIQIKSTYYKVSAQ